MNKYLAIIAVSFFVKLKGGFLFIFGVLVQLVRMPPCHGGGREFKSRTRRHYFLLIFIKKYNKIYM